MYRPRPGERLRAETELAVVVAEDGNPAAVAGALEIVDVRRPEVDEERLERIVTGNCFHRAFALGDPVETLPDGLEAVTRVDGESVKTAWVPDGAADTAIRQADRLLHAAGERLLPGDTILAGGLTHVPVAPGQRVTAAMDGLGAVSLTLSAP